MEPAVLTVEGYKPKKGLLPIAPGLVPVNPGERVAFKEDHPEHGGKYGLIKAIGYEEGHIRLEVLVFDPFNGVTEDDNTIKRITLEEIQ